jgi:hypothetical protein
VQRLSPRLGRSAKYQKLPVAVLKNGQSVQGESPAAPAGRSVRSVHRTSSVSTYRGIGRLERLVVMLGLAIAAFELLSRSPIAHH